MVTDGVSCDSNRPLVHGTHRLFDYLSTVTGSTSPFTFDSVLYGDVWLISPVLGLATGVVYDPSDTSLS